MSNCARMEQEIEELRINLSKLVAEHDGDLRNTEVMKLSSQLDHVIVEYQRAKMQRTADSKG